MQNAKKTTAFKMKLQGVPYETIAHQTGLSVFTLRKYFSTKGRWYREYQDWSTAELTKIRETFHGILMSQALDAAKAIGEGLHSDNPQIVLRAAQDILDRAGFQKNSSGWNRQSDSDDVAEQIVRRYESHHK